MNSNSEILDEFSGSNDPCDNLNTAMISESGNCSNDLVEITPDLRLNSSGFGLESSNLEECQRMTESLRALHQKSDQWVTTPPEVDVSSIMDTLPLINVSLPVSSSDTGESLLNKTIDMDQNKSILSFLFNPIDTNPEVESLIYWRDVKKGGAIFVGGLVLIFTLIYCTLISVISYLSMMVLSGTIAFRTYKMIMQAIQKNSFEHPFKAYLEMDLKLSDTKSKEVANLMFDKSYEIIDSLRRLFLVEDMVDSIKFFIGLYFLTYLGKWFNGLTICLLVFLSLFTLPKIYEVNKSQIDANLYLVSNKCNEIALKIKAMLPMGQKKPDDDKKKD